MASANAKGLRADKVLAELFPEHSRSKIKDLIENGKVEYRNGRGEWVLLRKAGLFVEPQWNDVAHWRLDADDWTRFVSRGGLKLQGVLDHFSISVNDGIYLDVGLSTGGFTDCLLQRGADFVYGVDVGKEQLHPRLRDHDQLLWRDKVNARHPFVTEDLEVLKKRMAGRPSAGDGLFDGIVVDVSFISLEKVIPNVVSYLKPGGDLVALVKPQFELGADALNGKGVLRAHIDPLGAVEKNIAMFQGHRLKIEGWVPSAIEGENGNKEFFIWATGAKET